VKPIAYIGNSLLVPTKYSYRSWILCNLNGTGGDLIFYREGNENLLGEGEDRGEPMGYTFGFLALLKKANKKVPQYTLHLTFMPVRDISLWSVCQNSEHLFKKYSLISPLKTHKLKHICYSKITHLHHHTLR
jgi:hypothetical protein